MGGLFVSYCVTTRVAIYLRLNICGWAKLIILEGCKAKVWRHKYFKVKGRQSRIEIYNYHQTILDASVKIFNIQWWSYDICLISPVNALEYLKVKCMVILCKQGMMCLIILGMSTLQITSGAGIWSCPNHTDTNITLLKQYKSRIVHEMYVHRDIGLVCLQSDVFSSLGNIEVRGNGRTWTYIVGKEMQYVGNLHIQYSKHSLKNTNVGFHYHIITSLVASTSWCTVISHKWDTRQVITAIFCRWETIYT